MLDSDDYANIKNGGGPGKIHRGQDAWKRRLVAFEFWVGKKGAFRQQNNT